MIRVMFLRDYDNYSKGSTALIPYDRAKDLIKANFAVVV